MTAIHCPSCRAENDGASETCFHCGRNLFDDRFTSNRLYASFIFRVP